MKSPKKVTKSEGSKKKSAAGPVKKQNKITDPKESNRLIMDDEDDFDIPLEDDIPGFDDFVDDDDDF